MNGQQLIDIANQQLMGYQNAVDQDALLTFLNEGKDEVWGILKTLNDEYFMVVSQATVSADDNYFGPIIPTERSYDLPANLREIKFIECTTNGYTDMKFVYRKITDEAWRDSRRNSNNEQTSVQTITEMLYSIIDKRTFILAAFPPVNLTLILYYIRNIPDFEATDDVDEILIPFTKKIADFACKKAMLGVQDQEQFAAWSQEWRLSIISLAQQSAPRNQADPEYVQDFWG